MVKIDISVEESSRSIQIPVIKWRHYTKNSLYFLFLMILIVSEVLTVVWITSGYVIIGSGIFIVSWLINAFVFTVIWQMDNAELAWYREEMEKRLSEMKKKLNEIKMEDMHYFISTLFSDKSQETKS